MGIVAVTGATGQVGGRVSARLSAKGMRHRALARHPGRILPSDLVEVAAFEGYDDEAGLRAAFAGVDDLVLVSAHEHPDRVSLHRTVVEEAAAAGVQRVVYVSFLGAAPDATFTYARDHWHTEQLLRESGLAWVALRSSLYHAGWPLFVGDDGTLRGPAADGRVASVAHDDVADVVVAALRIGVGSREGYVRDVTGPELLTLEQLAEQLSTAVGRTITYVPETLDEAYASRAGYGAADWEVEGWVSTYTAIAAGELDVVSTTVEDLTGHPAQSFAAWLDANPGALNRLRRTT